MGMSRVTGGPSGGGEWSGSCPAPGCVRAFLCAVSRMRSAGVCVGWCGGASSCVARSGSVCVRDAWRVADEYVCAPVARAGMPQAVWTCVGVRGTAGRVVIGGGRERDGVSVTVTCRVCDCVSVCVELCAEGRMVGCGIFLCARLPSRCRNSHIQFCRRREKIPCQLIN